MNDPVSGYGRETPTTRLPMFPLNAVLFPGMSLPLRIFEDRYLAMVRHLLTIEDPTMRVFGTVGIREGYEVGDHGSQSLYRIGVRLQITEIEEQPDGTFELVALARDRIRLDEIDASGEFPIGTVSERPAPAGTVPEETLIRARALFTAYRAAVSDLGTDPYTGLLPRDPEFLSWTLSAVAPLALAERQSLLEADDLEERLALVIDYLRSEVEAINVIPSLPATEVARTRWSPN